jgi:hypothetical protein
MVDVAQRSLEILPSGTWRVMTTLTAKGTSGLVDLRLDVDPAASSANWLVLRGHGLLDRRAFGIGAPVWTFSSQLRLDVAVHARREGRRTRTQRKGGSRCTTTMPG